MIVLIKNKGTVIFLTIDAHQRNKKESLFIRKVISRNWNYQFVYRGGRGI